MREPVFFIQDCVFAVDAETQLACDWTQDEARCQRLKPMAPRRMLTAVAIVVCVAAGAGCQSSPRTSNPAARETTAILRELPVEVDGGVDPLDPVERAFNDGLRLAQGLWLELPFPRGTVALCAQGNQSPEGYTHSLAQNRYSLDFAVRGQTTVIVTAAAAGVVTEVVDFETNDLDAGNGYGRQVVVEHEGLETRYSHLESLSVSKGQRVDVATPLGRMGASGHAFDRHLHFSLQVRTQQGGRVEIPIVHLRAAALGLVEAAPLLPAQINPQQFKGEEFIARPALPWSGTLYASVSHSLPPSERELVAQQAELLRTTLKRRLAMERLIEELKYRPVHLVQYLLEPYLAAAPDDPVTLYYYAVAVLIPKGRWADAEAALAKAATSAVRSEYYEGWLPGWIAAQRALVAKRRRMHGSTPPSQREQRALADAFAAALELFPAAELEQFVEHETRDLRPLNVLQNR